MKSIKTNIGSTVDFPAELGCCVQIEEKQIAIYYVPDTQQQWFAIDNFNPQNQRMVLSRGIIGSEKGIPFVACPLHKHRYSLIDGTCLTDKNYKVASYEILEECGKVFVCL